MEGMWIYLLILLVFLLLLYSLKQQRLLQSYPSGPFPLPFIGSIWRIGFRYSEDTLIKMAKQYGNVYTVWAANLPIVILSGFQTVKEGLVNNLEELSERPQTPFFATFGQRRGIILSNGHIWKQQRRFGLVTMRKLGLGKKGMENQIEEEARKLVEIFAREKGQPCDPSAAITNSVSNVTFGHWFSLEDETFKKLFAGLEHITNFMGSFPQAGLERV